MKALELIVYPQSGFGYTIPLRVWSPASCDPEDDFKVTVSEDDIQARIESKRLTDAELAAEYYSQDARCRHEQWIETVRGDDDYEDWERAMQSQMYDQLSTLHRFATLPHYDEDQP